MSAGYQTALPEPGKYRVAATDLCVRGGANWDKRSKGTGVKAFSEATAPEAATGPLVPTLAPLVDLGPSVQRLAESAWHADEHGTFDPCPVPGHAGTARLIEHDGELRLGCCTGRWRSLGEVLAARAYRRDVFRTNIEIAVWTRRLAWEAGTFQALEVAVPHLPQSASDNARHLRNGFVLLIGLRWADGEHRPVAFSARFAAAWSQRSRRSANEAIRELVEHGVIRVASRKGRTPLYLPCPPLVGELLGENG